MPTGWVRTEDLLAEPEVDIPEEVVHNDAEVLGELAPSAASVLMKIMYAARMARFDLLRPVQWLAKFMTKWTRVQDAELHRLVCYINSTKHWKTCGWVVDHARDIFMQIYSDSDWAGSKERFSTSGSLGCLRGPNTFFPLTARSKKQTTIATSSTEAEITAAQVALQKQAFPTQQLWNTICVAD